MSNISPVGLCGLEALYYEMDQLEDTSRKVARDARHSAQHTQLEALREQADHTERAALLEGVAQIYTGATAMLGAVGEGRALSDAEGAATETAAAAATREGAIVAKSYEALGQVAAGTLTALSGAQDAAGQRCAGRAAAAAMRADDAKDVEDESRSAQEHLLRNLETTQQIRRDLVGTLVRA